MHNQQRNNLQSLDEMLNEIEQYQEMADGMVGNINRID